MKNNALQAINVMLFAFDSCQIRAIKREGEVWFVATDVCASLGYTNPTKAIGDHLDDDEFMTALVPRTPNESLGVETNIISESGLYALVLRSRKPEARRFRKWVTREVLPSIRQTGEYVNADLKAKIAALRSNNEDLEAENRDMQATLCNMCVTYQQLYTIEHAILRHITNAPGQHSSAALESLVRRDVECTNSDYWHAMSDLYNRYKISQNRAGFWELAR